MKNQPDIDEHDTLRDGVRQKCDWFKPSDTANPREVENETGALWAPEKP
jgi:hypothetical protein